MGGMGGGLGMGSQIGGLGMGGTGGVQGGCGCGCPCAGWCTLCHEAVTGAVCDTPRQAGDIPGRAGGGPGAVLSALLGKGGVSISPPTAPLPWVPAQLPVGAGSPPSCGCHPGALQWTPRTLHRSHSHCEPLTPSAVPVTPKTILLGETSRVPQGAITPSVGGKGGCPQWPGLAWGEQQVATAGLAPAAPFLSATTPSLSQFPVSAAVLGWGVGLSIPTSHGAGASETSLGPRGDLAPLA